MRRIVGLLLTLMIVLPLTAWSFGGNSGSSGGGGGASTTQGIGGGATSTPGADSVVNVKNYGAKGDGKIAYDGAMTSTIGYAQGASAAPSAPTVTTTVANDVVVSIIGQYANGGAGGTLTAPATPTSRVNLASTATLYGVYAGDQLVAAAGSVPAQTGSMTSGDWTAVTIPLASKNGTSISFIGVNTCAVTSGSACNITTPTTIAGDLVINCDLIFSNSNIPAGAATTGSYVLGSKVTNAHQSLYCYEHPATASEPATQVFASNGSVGQTGITLVYRNAGFDNPLTSASAAFVSGDVGKIICMTGTSAVNTAVGNVGCGIIEQQVSGTSIITSIPNATGGSVSAQEYRYATNDDTAFASALTAVSTNGGTMFVPQGMYGRTSCMALPTNAGVNILGVGGGINSSNLVSAATLTQMTTALLYLTKFQTCGAAIQMVAAVGHPQQLYADRIQDITLAAGSGHLDFAGFGGDAVDITDWSDALLYHVSIMGFSGAGIDFEIPSGGTGNDGTIDNVVRDSWLNANTTNIRMANVNTGGLLEANRIENDIIQGANNNNIEMDTNSPTDSTTIEGNTIQFGGVANLAGFAELKIQGNSTNRGCVISGNHFEAGTANTNNISFSPTSAGTLDGCNISSNFFQGGGSATAVVIGADATHLVSGAIVTNNAFASCIGACITHNTTNSFAKGNDGAGTEITWHDSPWSVNWSGAANAVVSNAAANVFPISGVGTPVATTSEGTVSVYSPVVATARNLKCTLTNAAGTATVAGGTNYVLALRQNLATSALTCTITAAISTCTDTTHAVTIAIGDQLDSIATPTGTPTALIPHCSVELDY